MDLVLVGLPGSGKSVVGKRLAARRAARFIDLDAEIERASGATIAELFASEGEAGFRARERAAIDALGGPDTSADVRRVVATGGGALVDPRNRWSLLRGRRSAWLDVRPEVAAQRLRSSRHVRPLVAGSSDPVGAVRALRAARERFYAAAELRITSVADPVRVAATIEQALAENPRPPAGTTLLRARTPIGAFAIGERTAADELRAVLDELGARRAILVSEPAAWAAAGAGIAERLRDAGREIATLMLPQGEPAKRLSVIEDAARELVALRADRREPLVAIGGGALGDAVGFLAAVWLRGVPVVQVPTTLVAQIDSAIGGKTAVDLPEGKNLLGAFHQPTAVVVDVALLASLPDRERRAALGEAVKMAVLGDERLFALLESDGRQIAAGASTPSASSALAELVERCLWAKVEVVVDDERETADGPDLGAGRLALNLGHTVGHGLEAAAGFRDLRHGEAVAYGLRAACRIGAALDVTPAARADRVESLLDELGLAVTPLALDRAVVRAAMGADKKHAAGRLRWIVPTAEGVVVRTDVPDELVDAVIDSVGAGRSTAVPA
jgi:3-dehydroquinate synthetase/shikimate kinase